MKWMDAVGWAGTGKGGWREGVGGGLEMMEEDEEE
jgi:hypothetical protein